MSNLFERAVSLVIAPVDGGPGIDASELRVEFSVKKTSVSSPNKATLRVYNLAKPTRERIVAKKQAVILKAGYVGQLWIVASGVVQRVEHSSKPPEVVTEIEIRDGGLGLDDSVFRKAYAAGTPRSAIVKDIVAAMPDVSTGALVASGLTGTIPGKMVFSGPARRCLDKAARSWRFEWSVQDGVLQATDRTGTSLEKIMATVLSPTTGLIGSPTKTDQGCKTQSLLLPIKPGEWIDVRSDFLTGYYKALTVEHKGDTHGDDWTTEVEAKDINSKSAGKKKRKK